MGCNPLKRLRAPSFLRLPLLAPDIVDTILGRRAHHVALMLDSLEWPVPASWGEQPRVIRSAPPPWGANAIHGLPGLTR